MEPQTRALFLLLALAMAAIPTGSFAQQTAPDVQQPAPEVPSYARPSGDETITGRVLSFDGAYSLEVRDDRGFVDKVRMRQGTIINPTGITLASGMSVTIHGVNTGSVFAANEIDTPYQSYGYAYPVYPAYGFAYPGFGYPFGWGRASIGIGFGFGWGGYRRW